MSNKLLDNKYINKLLVTKYPNLNTSNTSNTLLKNMNVNNLLVGNLKVIGESKIKYVEPLSLFFTYYFNDVNININNDLIEFQVNTFHDSTFTLFSDRPRRISYKINNDSHVQFITEVLFDENKCILMGIDDLYKINLIIVINDISYIINFVSFDNVNYKFIFKIIEKEKDKQHTQLTLNNISIELLTTSIKYNLSSSFFYNAIYKNTFGFNKNELNLLLDIFKNNHNHDNK